MQNITLPMKDRKTAGKALANALLDYAGRDDVIVLTLPRGGVPVAYEVASRLQVNLDLITVRKLGTPGQRELAMGAIASGGIRVLNQDIINSLHISDAAIEATTEQETVELERREHAYRGDHPRPEIKGQCVILVDDGIATGATMRAGIQALKQLEPAEIIVAVAVAPEETVKLLEQEVDTVVCLASPEPFYAISYWYDAFPQVQDDEVSALLNDIWQRNTLTESI